jgi:hypothetical protein
VNVLAVHGYLSLHPGSEWLQETGSKQPDGHLSAHRQYQLFCPNRTIAISFCLCNADLYHKETIMAIPI